MHKDLQNKHYVRWVNFLKRTEKWDVAQIEKYQLKQLQKMFKLSKKLKGYQDRYEKLGLNKLKLNNINDIIKIPTTCKSDMQGKIADYSLLCNESNYITTGGSTGIPFGFYRGENSFSKELASKAYQYYRVGWKEGDRQMVFRGLPIKNKSRMEYFPEYEELRCSSYYLTDSQMEKYRLKAWKYCPNYIKCYPSSGYALAKYLNHSGRKFPPIKAVLCASENLYDYQKLLMEKVFNCRIFSHYGHYELAGLAGYCEYKDTYHVLPQYGYVELIDKKGNPVNKIGKIGEIVTTSFIMDDTLFFRYRTGDMARYGGVGCKTCGRPYLILSKIEGRIQEHAITGDGRMISMTSINMHDNVFENIRQFQFKQHKKGEIIFQYIVNNNNIQINKANIISRLSEKFGQNMKVRLIRVDKIRISKRGKLKFLDQRLNINKYENN